jgi:alpha-ketoglutarate-dependent taurine dioxygenase
MTDETRGGPAAAPRPGSFQRRSVSLAPESLIESRPLFGGVSGVAGGELPLLVTPRMDGVDLVSWAANHRPWLDEHLLRHGGLLFRGFGLDRPAHLESLIHGVAGEALEYRERSSPRSAVEGRIYTSTDYPPEHAIFLHNENSYQSVWPLKIFFFCQQAAAEGGETPIADCRRVLARIDPAVRERFEAKGWMYVRNFGDGFGLDWRTVFQTDDTAAVEEHCRRGGIEVEWKSDGRLRTRAVRPALTPHPKTGELLWFNHATFFHVSTLEPEVREALLAEFAAGELPANTYYGDGSPIEPETLAHLRSLYQSETRTFPWQSGDVLLLDNMMVAHGRSPYRGARKILVGMAEPVSR